jgi:hypothetical protein
MRFVCTLPTQGCWAAMRCGRCAGPRLGCEEATCPQAAPRSTRRGEERLDGAAAVREPADRRGGIDPGELLYRRLPGRHRFLAFMPQWDFLDFVVGQARRLPTFTVRMQAEALGVLQEAGRVVGLTYRDGDGAVHQVHAQLTVAADGRDSRLRRSAGLRPRVFGAPLDLPAPRNRATATGPGAAAADRPHGQGEPTLGLPAHRGRAAPARHAGLGNRHPHHAAPSWAGSDVGSVPSAPSASTGC